MKRRFTSIIAAIICIMITITGVTCINTDTAYAASKKTPFTLTYQGKTITLADNVDDCLAYGIYGSSDINRDTLAKTFGKPDFSDNHYDEWTTNPDYMYATRNITFYESDPDESGCTERYIDFKLVTKKDAVCGIKIGTKKATVLKKLKKIMNKKNIHIDNDSDMIRIYNEKERLEDGSDVACVCFIFTKNKLSAITGQAYSLED